MGRKRWREEQGRIVLLYNSARDLQSHASRADGAPKAGEEQEREGRRAKFFELTSNLLPFARILSV